MRALRRARFGLACAAILAAGGAGIRADEISDLFTNPETEATAAAEATEGSPSLLEEYHRQQEKFSFSFDLTSAAGAYLGWKTFPTADTIASGFSHSSVGGVTFTTALDIRPYDYLRLHGAVAIVYPTTVNGSLLFGATIQELFFDYATQGLLAVRAGRFPVSWGNARIIGVADLPGRVIDTSDLSKDVTIQPDWIAATKPSTWLKAALPLGGFSVTGLTGFPSDPDDLSFRAMAYGLLLEYQHEKTSFGLSGFFQRSYTTRAALTAKTALFGCDVFVDGALSFPYEATPLPSATAGLFYQASGGPKITCLLELRYNGERDAVSGDLVPDAPDIGGLSSAAALSWSEIGGSPLTVGATWYHAYADNSGVVVPALSVDVARLASIRSVFPFAYGPENGEYRKKMPSESGGFALGMGIALVLKASF
ncbi:MAG: hypothetical protein JNG85_04240 [Spirochaetaceae bacterium]|nr:hypothetical protein [Spirochaetaceae bacterium]